MTSPPAEGKRLVAVTLDALIKRRVQDSLRRRRRAGLIVREQAATP